MTGHGDDRSEFHGRDLATTLGRRASPVEEEAAALPLPGLRDPITVRWDP